MRKRGPDRRWHARGPGLLLPERRDGFDRRQMESVPAIPGTIRPGVGEVAPQRERRSRPESGCE